MKPPHPPNYPHLQHSQLNDPTRSWKKSQTANRISSTGAHLEHNFLRQTDILIEDYNSFFRTYSLRWRHQEIMVLKVKYLFCSWFLRINFSDLDFALKCSVVSVPRATKKSNSNFASVFSFLFRKIKANVDDWVESLRGDFSKWGAEIGKRKKWNFEWRFRHVVCSRNETKSNGLGAQFVTCVPHGFSSNFIDFLGIRHTCLSFKGYISFQRPKIEKRKKWKYAPAFWQWVKANDGQKILQQVADFVTFLATTFRLTKYVAWISVHYVQSDASVEANVTSPASSDIGASDEF